ncbi:MAG: nucleotidyltransferase domain-containing protein [Patescibacteria group bacterium]
MTRGVFKAIVYYDCLDYPLTKEELESFSFKDEGEIKNNLIQLAKGFHFLKGREALIQLRKERNQIAEEKWEKTLKAVKWLRLIPYIRLVFASGSLALSNTDEESDLDVLIVTKSGRIWITRFLTVFILSLLGARRTRYEKIAPDKICLNHFITDKSLYIPRKSIYTAQLYSRLVPITGEKDLIDRFFEANSWIRNYIPKFPISNFQFPNKFQIPNSNFLKLIRNIEEKILDTKLGDWIERILKKYQLRRINNYHLTHKPGGRIKADNESLEFHPDSPELRIIERYNKIMLQLGFEDLTEKSSFVI